MLLPQINLKLAHPFNGSKEGTSTSKRTNRLSMNGTRTHLTMEVPLTAALFIVVLTPICHFQENKDSQLRVSAITLSLALAKDFYLRRMSKGSANKLIFLS